LAKIGYETEQKKDGESYGKKIKILEGVFVTRVPYVVRQSNTSWVVQ